MNAPSAEPLDDGISPGAASDAGQDRRLYVLDVEWSVAVNRGSTSHYCYSRNPDQDFFHLILDGEIFVHNGDEKFCLNCALRLGLISSDRQFWQQRQRSPGSGL